MAKDTEKTDNTERASRGTSLTARIKSAFMEIVGEYLTSGQVAGVTWESAKEVFDSIPVSAAVGIPPEIQIANIDQKVREMFDSKNVDEKELRLLLNRKERLNKIVNKEKESAKGAGK